ncbi:MAG: hypothetical protein HY700_09325 [Gemmatimonadetes bacterium]|nr:hypothetical protein [Gemmatimonadota bacterium]
MSVATLGILLQAGALLVSPPAPTVGDTITVTRTIDVPAEARARAQPLGSSLLIEPLAEPIMLRTRKGIMVRYTFAMFEAGRHPVGLPPVELLYRDGRVELRPEDTAWVSVRSVLPPGDTLPQPAGSLGPIARHPTDARPLLVATATVLLAAGGWAVTRRRRRRRRESEAAPAAPAAPPVERWIAAGEARAVAAVVADRLRNRIAELAPEADRALSAEECIGVLERRRPDWPLRDLSDALRALERARFAPAVPGDVAALVRQVGALLQALPEKSAS